MRRVENRGEKAIRAAQKAARCAATEPPSLSEKIATGFKGKQAEAESEEMLKPVGALMRGAGEVFHADPRETEWDLTKAVLFDTLEHPNMISVNASEDRLEVALQAGVLESAVDAAETVQAGKTVQAGNSLEKMLAHQMAAAHQTAMKLVARGLNERLSPVESARLTNAAARLMQVYQEALLTLHKIRHGGKQVVVVQHVEVSGGGQAVIAGSMKGGARGPQGGEGGENAQ